MDKEVEKFRKDICDVYEKAGLDIEKEEPYVYDNEQYWEALSQKFDRDYNTLSKVLNACSRPNINEIEDYNRDPTKKISDTQYKFFDDKTFGLYPKDITTYENLTRLILRYEEQEKKHVHKGTIFYFLGEQYLMSDYIEKGLLYINKAFKEDDMNHKDATIKFPDSPAYKFIILNMEDPNQALRYIVEHIGNFLKNNFLDGYSYTDFFDRFLNAASTKTSLEEAHTWLDHVIFFNSFIVQLKKVYRMPPEIFDSIFGEIMLSNIIGNLCLLIESFCKVKLGINGTFNKIYSDPEAGVTNLYNWTGASVTASDFQGNHLKGTLSKIFSNHYKSTDSHSTDSLQNSFYLSWGLRNNFHHNIESMAIIKDNFREIIKKQLDFFFDFAINK